MPTLGLWIARLASLVLLVVLARIAVAVVWGLTLRVRRALTRRRP